MPKKKTIRFRTQQKECEGSENLIRIIRLKAENKRLQAELNNQDPIIQDYFQIKERLEGAMKQIRDLEDELKNLRIRSNMPSKMTLEEAIEQIKELETDKKEFLEFWC